MTYDWLNRLTHKGYPDSTGVDYIYDLVGKIKQVSDPTGTYAFAYDNMGRLIGTSTQYSFIPGQTFSNTYSYDAASNRTGFTAPDSSTTTYAYDALNRLTDQTNSWAGHFIFGYDDLSRRTSLTRPNGINTSYSYDNLSRLLSVLHQQGTNTVDGAIYTYDNSGNRLSKQNMLNNITEHYDYDAIYQLKHVIQDLSGGGQTTTESYTYDQIGNRLSALNVAQYSYDSSNHLNSSSDGVSYTYDNNGNTLTKTDANGTTQYAWDFENRLTSVTLPGSGGVVSFKYDPFGRRIQKNSSSPTNYLYDEQNVINELDTNGNLVARYGQGAGVDEHLSELRSGTTTYYDQDGTNSVTSLSNTTGALANSYTYDTFGNLLNSTGTTASPFQYTGRDFDPETGLRYHRARYYWPDKGRFISEDPLGIKGDGMNFYSYVGNRPTMMIDPSGLLAEVLCESVKQYHLGFFFSARHCRLRVACADAGIPDYTYELNGRSAAQPFTAEPFQPSRPGFHPPMSAPKTAPTDCMNNCSFEKCLVNRVRMYMANPQNIGQYHPVNHNSNWWVWDVVTSCNGDVNFDRFQTIDGIPQYNFYGQMPDR